MLKKLILENWKSFRYAELPIDPLTVLIGTNASGKSNALEALDLLRRMAGGQGIQAALAGDRTTSSIRGGMEWAVFKPKTQFTLKALVQGEDEYTDYSYKITIETKPHFYIFAESLIRISRPSQHSESLNEICLFQTQVIPDDIDCMIMSISKNSELNISVDSSYSVLSRYSPKIRLEKEVFADLSMVLRKLQNIFTLDPIPAEMRSYSPLSESLQRDASNIAGVLAALPDEQKQQIESILSTYTTRLPEQDIKKVWAETVGRLNTDAMLYCEEGWMVDKSPLVIDARGMSDGTLRFLAILTALLTRPEGSQLVIEEVDNGLHPSRADLLLKMLREIGEQRHIDILVTTHNPALLNALEPEMLPFVIVAHRDSQTGESKLTPLEDLENLPKLMASGPLGKLAEQGSIERSLSGA